MKQALLKNFSLLSNFTEKEIGILSDYCHTEKLKKREIVYAPGDIREKLRFVLKGQIEMQASDDSRFDEPTTIFGPGQFIGEACVLQEGTIHKSKAVAKETLELLVLTREKFEQLLHEQPKISGKLQMSICSFIFNRLSLISNSSNVLLSGYSHGRKRIEHDLIGERELPYEAYYGIQTLRALENFNITGMRLRDYPVFIKALAQVKKAAALANEELGILPKNISKYICLACDEIVGGHWHDQFLVDMIQGGAGTSTNMNANEVIANRALELAGFEKGDYEKIHPNNHVNLGQSTNDAYPTAIRLAALQSFPNFHEALKEIIIAFKEKSVEFSDVIKMGRTQLQDAVPMTLGQEFEAFAITLAEDLDRITENEKLFLELSLGGTAIGTGINTHPKYAGLAIKKLRLITGLDLVKAPNFIEATPDTGAFVLFSGVIKRLAVKLSKICNDLRLLSSGPRCGFGDITLPPMQPGSSIMPGKVNPVIPEVVNQVAFQVIGNDLAITMASEGGQLQLNAFEPVMVFNLFQNMNMLARAMKTLARLCVKDIKANRENCRRSVENSIGLVTALNPLIGYENSTMIALEALETGQSVFSLVLKHNLLSKEKLEEALKPENMLSAKFK